MDSLTHGFHVGRTGCAREASRRIVRLVVARMERKGKDLVLSRGRIRTRTYGYERDGGSLDVTRSIPSTDGTNGRELSWDEGILSWIERILERSPNTEDGRKRSRAASGVMTQLVSLGLGHDTIVAGLLADAVHRGAVRLEEIETKAGANVADLTHDAARLRALPARGAAHDDDSARALRNFCLAFHDARSIAVALAWRLDLLRHSEGLPSWRKQQLALETMQIYAPLSHALRVESMRDELEDRAFAVLFPKSYGALAEWMREKRSMDESILSSFETELKEALKEETKLKSLCSEIVITKRRKSLFSTMRKLLRAGYRAQERVPDVLGIRVIVRPLKDPETKSNAEEMAKDACYIIWDIARKHWKSFEEKEKDYIKRPKSNGYRSLHATLRVQEMDPSNGEMWDGCLELQVRTSEMDADAENGCASHAAYKGEVIPALSLSASLFPEEEDTNEYDISSSMTSTDDEDVGFFSLFDLQVNTGQCTNVPTKHQLAAQEESAQEESDEAVSEEEFQELKERLEALARADARTEARLLMDRSKDASIHEHQKEPAQIPRRKRPRRQVLKTKAFLEVLQRHMAPDMLDAEALRLDVKGCIPSTSETLGSDVFQGLALNTSSRSSRVSLSLSQQGKAPDGVLYVFATRGDEAQIYLGSDLKNIEDWMKYEGGNDCQQALLVVYVARERGGRAPTLRLACVGSDMSAKLNGAPLHGIHDAELWIQDTISFGPASVRLMISSSDMAGNEGLEKNIEEPEGGEEETDGVGPYLRRAIRSWKDGRLEEARDSFRMASEAPQRTKSCRASALCAWAAFEATRGDAASASILYREACREALGIQGEAEAIDVLLIPETGRQSSRVSSVVSRALQGGARLEHARGAKRRSRAMHQLSVWLTPNDSKAYAAYARDIKEEDPDGALELLELGLRACPMDPMLLLERAKLLLRVAKKAVAGGHTELANGLVDACREAHEIATLISPGNGSVWLSYGRLEMLRGDVERARQRYASGLRICPNHPGLLRVTAEDALRRGEAELAWSLLQRLANSNEADEASLRAAARIARERGEDVDADRWYARARRLRRCRRSRLPPWQFNKVKNSEIKKGQQKGTRRARTAAA